MYELVCPTGQALPEFITTTQEFASIVSKLPFAPQHALHELAAHDSPLVRAEALALAAALVCWTWYLVTKNCSHVDRMWSIVPPFYVAFFAAGDLRAVTTAVLRTVLTEGASGPGAGAGSKGLAERLAAVPGAVAASGTDVRLLVAAALSAAWGCRLTYNFWRRGGYSLRYEDYRWAEVRKIMPPVVFELFNLVFVALAQHILCLLITLPAFVAWTAAGGPNRFNHPSGSGIPSGTPSGSPPMGAADWAAAGAFALLLLGETVSDQQQWAFQCRKHALIAAGAPREGDYRRGFRTTGLFRFSRHPSFFCEEAIWWAFYVLCAALPSRCALGPAAVGAIGLSALFHGGSLWITERISAQRYPAYKDYQRTTSAILPWLPGPPLPERRD